MFLFAGGYSGRSGGLMIELSAIRLRVAPRRRKADEWALVLEAEGLSPRVWQAPEGFVVGVPAEEAERASAALFAYESENPPRPPEVLAETAGSAHLYVALAVWVVLLDLFFITDAWAPAARWFEYGSADAERIVAGELWRSVTALTLHADLKHALANAIAGAIFLTAVCRRLGPGLGVALVLLTGVGGNLINAFAHDAFHVSVGASTAVFGAVGMLGGIGVVRRRRLGVRGRYAWIPLAAGLALLAMLGTTGERIDLWAHLFGFVVGSALGLAVALAVPVPPRARVQWAFGLAALALVVLSWAAALHSVHTPKAVEIQRVSLPHSR